MVHDGLLGEEGSSLIADFLEVGLTDPSAKEFRGLHALDSSMSELINILQLGIEELGFGALSRTHSILHETGLAPEHAPEPSEYEASYWLGNFVQKAIMVLFCLGPVRGTLELQPYDEEAEAYEIPTIPGSFIVLRADAMWHRHFAHSKAHILSCWLVRPQQGSSRKYSMSDWQVPPCATSLEQWAINRMKQLKEEAAEEQKIPDLPSGWVTAMNHMFHTAQRVAIRGSAGRYCATWTIENFWLSQSSGVDLVTGVPLSRWDVEPYYDSDAEGWRSQKSFSTHGSFVDGLEFFDNKFFGLSPLEASGMDPHQRTVLEVGYEALHKAGYSKGKLMNKVGGVYLGSSQTSFAMVTTNTGATGAAASINSNRFSFCLGLKGPSMTVDTDGSSALTAVHLGGEAVLSKGQGVSNAFSLSGGVHYQLGPFWLPQMQAAGLLSAVGRCLTFDCTADGYVLGDGVGFVVLKRLADWVDGQQVYVEGEPLIGSLCGSTCSSNGMAASLTAPHGPSEQELIAQTLKTAGLEPMNIDAVECDGQGAFLSDAVEVDSLLRMLRGEEIEKPLSLGALKSRLGFQTECSGIASLQKVLLSGVWGVMAPNNHLTQLNPHLDFDSKANFLTDCLDYELQSSYVGVSAKGFGGTNVHAICYTSLDQSRAQQKMPEPKRNYFNFWPGGGGELEEDQHPLRGYFIAGTWSRWKSEKMQNEGEDSYGFTITLGENRWEEFHIMLDGDDQRILHPDRPHAPKGSPVEGPDAQAGGRRWRLEGRGKWMDVPTDATEEVDLGKPEITSKAVLALSQGLSKEADGAQELRKMELGTSDVGMPGDKYRVHLKIAGKYRTVLWEKLLDDDFHSEHTLPEGEYSIIGSWNRWIPEAMSRHDGSWHLEVQLPTAGAEFQVLRNEDWSQMICPKARMADASENGAGPDHCSLFRGGSWYLDGKPGDVFQIKFQREQSRLETGEIEDVKRISWDKIRESPDQSLALRSAPELAVIGSWDGFARIVQMSLESSTPQNTVYSFYVQLGPQGVEGFQLVQDFDWSRIVHPDRPVTSSGAGHRTLVSPISDVSKDQVWAVGLDRQCSPGDIFKVEITALGDVVLRVAWSPFEDSKKLKSLRILSTS
eukprot:TRINITY_DN47990_c0_g1_i1.p1 TRINITY_DN47990_c0_g1~~TRINITY_DN47990_c0_g1_i1.p1  ORF type:complete len:1197 (+),score=220.30 TRINITY_DN47990_c0_g1_i1:254-3592(+)